MLFQSNGICPICECKGENWCTTQDWEYRTTTDYYTYLKCPACNTIFLKELKENQLSCIYPANYYSYAQKTWGPLFKLKDLWDSLFYKSLLKKIAGAQLSILDVGGGAGQVLDVLKKTDKRIQHTEIVDIDERAKAIAEHKGHVYNCVEIENYTTTKKFDVVLLLNIIEHVASPALLIEKAASLLSDNGCIIIKTPNADSPDARLFQKHYWGGLHCPRHWIIFTAPSFKLMLGKMNLRLQKIKFTQGAPFWAWSLIQLFRKKDIHQQKTPLIYHPLFSPLSIIFAAWDMLRLRFSGKTSQMFIILSK